MDELEELRSSIKVRRSSVECVQMIKISSMYLTTKSSLLIRVCRNLRSITDMYILATVDEKGAPIAVPLIC